MPLAEYATEPRIADARGGDPTLVFWHFIHAKSE